MAALDRYIFTHCWPAHAFRSSSVERRHRNMHLTGNGNDTQQDQACRGQDEPGKGILQIPFNVRSLTLQCQFCVLKFCFMPYIYSPFIERRLVTVLTILGVLSWMGGILRENHIWKCTLTTSYQYWTYIIFSCKVFAMKLVVTQIHVLLLAVFFLNPLHYYIFWCPF